jgi:uncharacterized membrane protein YhaH (DUF805 family)
VVLLYGALMLGYVGLSAVIAATLPSVVASYVYAYFRMRGELVVVRLLTQFGVLMLAMCAFTALLSVLLWWDLSASKSSGRNDFGMAVFSFWPYTIWAALCVPVSLAGELALLVRRLRDA